VLISFVLDAALLFVFVTRITRNLRERDARLATLKQQTAEEDHIVRMGLLASGAAHELGTPLASLAVILGDWRRMPVIASNPELLQEVEEMQAAVKRCKSILTGVPIVSGRSARRGTARDDGEYVRQRAGGRMARCALSPRRWTLPMRSAPIFIVSDSALKQVGLQCSR
jgi:two-component system, sensor histidine kinase RegB